MLIHLSNVDPAPGQLLRYLGRSHKCTGRLPLDLPLPESYSQLLLPAASYHVFPPFTRQPATRLQGCIYPGSPWV